MKIYTKIVIDISCGEIIEEHSYDYYGPITNCGSGSSVPDTSGAILQGAKIQADATEKGIEDYLEPATEAGLKFQSPYAKAGKEALGVYSSLMGLQPETWMEPGSYSLQEYNQLSPENVPPGASPGLAAEYAPGTMLRKDEIPKQYQPGRDQPYTLPSGQVLTPSGSIFDPSWTAGEFETPQHMYPGFQPVDPTEQIRKTPGYQFQMKEAQRALERSQAARGMLESGQTLKGIVDYSQNIAGGYYQNYLNQLANLWGRGQAGATQMAGTAMTGGTQAAQAKSAAGAALGSGYIKAAQAKQQAAMANQGSGWGGVSGMLGGIGSIAGAIFSDERLKEDVKPLNALQKMDKIKTVSYKYKKELDPEQRPRAGFLAQDIEKVLPEAVVTGPQGYKMIDPLAINALTVEAIKELKQGGA